MHAAIALVEKVVVVILVLVIIFVLVVLVLVIVFQLNAVVAAIELNQAALTVCAPLQFDAGFHVSVGLQCALDAPPKFRERNVHFLGLPVFNVVLDLHHELLYGSEFRHMQFHFG